MKRLFDKFAFFVSNKSNFGYIAIIILFIIYSAFFYFAAVKKYQEGFPSSLIFKQAGFNIDLIGRKTPKWCIERWERTFRDKGINGLSTEARGKGGGRPKTNWQNDKEKIKYLETKIAYLKAENDFLAKLRKKSLN